MMSRHRVTDASKGTVRGLVLSLRNEDTDRFDIQNSLMPSVASSDVSRVPDTSERQVRAPISRTVYCHCACIDLMEQGPGPSFRQRSTGQHPVPYGVSLAILGSLLRC